MLSCWLQLAFVVGRCRAGCSLPLSLDDAKAINCKILCSSIVGRKWPCLLSHSGFQGDILHAAVLVATCVFLALTVGRCCAGSNLCVSCTRRWATLGY